MDTHSTLFCCRQLYESATKMETAKQSSDNDDGLFSRMTTMTVTQA